MLIGALMSFMLFGISIVQLYLYNLRFSNDKFMVQFSVYMIFLLEIFHSVTVGALAWNALCSGWGRFTSLLFPGWTFSAIPAVTGIISAWVQIFYAWRIHVLVNWKIIPIVIIVIALAQTAAALSIAIGFIPLKSILLLHSTFPRTIVWLGGAALADVIISISMVYVLYAAKKRVVGGDTEKVLNHLIRSTVETGIIATFCATMELGFFLGLPTTNIHVLFALMLSKLYSNTLMTSLNFRNIGSFQGSRHQETWNTAIPSQIYEHTNTSLGIIHISTDVEVFDRLSPPKKRVYEERDVEMSRF
ncbi:hypothetical protein BYT27DRAFT_7199723 [Phlegmacium glaucopus]|nr:hypothetical protein BYT27DRAFT_7199723 [Phlegmacium glaucopus]